MKLKFNNPWMKLYAASMGKIFCIEVITDSESEQTKRRKQQGLVSVSSLPGRPDIALLADCSGQVNPDTYLLQTS